MTPKYKRSLKKFGELKGVFADILSTVRRMEASLLEERAERKEALKEIKAMIDRERQRALASRRNSSILLK